MLLSRLIWQNNIFCFKNNVHKNSPRPADVTPYSCDEVLFRSPCGDNSQNTIFSQAAQREPLKKHAAVRPVLTQALTRAAATRSGARGAVCVHCAMMGRSANFQDRKQIFLCFS